MKENTTKERWNYIFLLSAGDLLSVNPKRQIFSKAYTTIIINLGGKSCGDIFLIFLRRVVFKIETLRDKKTT